MEALTRLVAESLARHGFDHPVDPRRLQWSRWFRCDSPHSLLVVPSKPGIFALAEEVAELGDGAYASSQAKVGGTNMAPSHAQTGETRVLGGIALQPCDPNPTKNVALAAEGKRRMLAVLQFSEDDDMAFVLDRMFTRPNPLRTRLASGLCFLRFVVIEDQAQRRGICSALNQWLISSAEKASGLGTDTAFTSSLELTNDDRVGSTLLSARARAAVQPTQATRPELRTDFLQRVPHAASPNLDSGAATNIHCPQPLPSGF